MSKLSQNIDSLSVNTIRMLAVDMINKANSGHPGIALGSAPILHTLFTKHMNVNPNDPQWINRDRFVLSAGHGSSALYAILHLLGYEISLDDLTKFRQIHSLTPGHPEITITPGIDATTGPLGQGLAMALGFAMAEKFLAGEFNQKDYEIFNHYTYTLCGDGCLQEGISQEMISLAGKHKLNKLIVLFDSNDIQLDSETKECVAENMEMRFKSAGWNYILVKDGNNVEEINKAITNAKESIDKPTLIEVKTIIGYGSPKQGTNSVHGAPIGIDGAKQTRINLGWTWSEEFFIPSEVKANYAEITKKKLNTYQKWNDMYKKYPRSFPYEFQLLEQAIHNDIDIDWNEVYTTISKKEKDSTRNISGYVIQAINQQIPHNLLAGSADLSVSTKVKGFSGIFNKEEHGNNILFGVRELAMAAIMNGIILHKGIYGYCSTFMTFADYVKPALRLSALMEIHTGYIFSHDSIMVGEDGPTHQPIEQLTMLRTIPNTYTFKPYNHEETIDAFRFNFLNADKTFVLITTRQEFPILPAPKNQDISCGAYILAKNKTDKYITILASGYEVAIALEVQKLLSNKLDIRIVSVPCLNLFLELSCKEQEKIIGKPTRKVVIEMADGIVWHSIIDKQDQLININGFGMSGKDQDLLKHFGFTPEAIKDKILKYKLKSIK